VTGHVVHSKLPTMFIETRFGKRHIARNLRMSTPSQYRGAVHQCARARVVHALCTARHSGALAVLHQAPSPMPVIYRLLRSEQQHKRRRRSMLLEQRLCEHRPQPSVLPARRQQQHFHSAVAARPPGQRCPCLGEYRPLRAVYTASQQLNCAQYAGVHVASNVPRSPQRNVRTVWTWFTVAATHRRTPSCLSA